MFLLLGTKKLHLRAESREFKAWCEEWDDDCKFKNFPIQEMSLLKKYGGLKFIDPDSNQLLRTMHANAMAWTRPTRSSKSKSGKEGGWNLICYDEKKYDPKLILTVTNCLPLETLA